MDQKKVQKEELLSSLEVAERQYSDTLQSHMEVVERLIGNKMRFKINCYPYDEDLLQI